MPNVSTITVAWTDGAAAGEIARRIAAQLGFRFLNGEILDRAAQQAGVDAATIASVEHRESLAARIWRSLSSVQIVELGGYNEFVADETPAYREIIKDVVRTAAAEGSTVIGLHGASVTLAGTPGLLRVFITAPRETRIGRIVGEKSVTEKEARAIVEKTDADRRDYFRKFFNIDDERPTQYDLVINTETVSTDAAVRAILSVARD
jgi:cytidylate kinase